MSSVKRTWGIEKPIDREGIFPEMDLVQHLLQSGWLRTD